MCTNLQDHVHVNVHVNVHNRYLNYKQSYMYMCEYVSSEYRVYCRLTVLNGRSFLNGSWSYDISHELSQPLRVKEVYVLQSMVLKVKQGACMHRDGYIHTYIHAITVIQLFRRLLCTRTYVQGYIHVHVTVLGQAQLPRKWQLNVS